MGFAGLDMLGGCFWRGKPCGQALLADVLLLLAAQEGTKVHRELVRATVVIRDRFRADFVGDTVDFDSAEDLRGIEQGVEHPRMMKTSWYLAR
jgi:hypothetical protein